MTRKASDGMKTSSAILCACAAVLAAARDVCGKKEPLKADGILALPLSCEEASSFGGVAFSAGL